MNSLDRTEIHQQPEQRSMAGYDFSLVKLKVPIPISRKDLPREREICTLLTHQYALSATIVHVSFSSNQAITLAYVGIGGSI